MDDRATKAVREIARERQQLADHVDALEQRVRESVSWRGYAGRHVWTTVALAFAGGFMLSRFFGRPMR